MLKAIIKSLKMSFLTLIFLSASTILGHAQQVNLLKAKRGSETETKIILPTTSAGKAMESFLARYNSGKLNEPRWARWYSIYGPVEIKSIERAEPNRIEVWTQGIITRGWINFSLSLDETDSRKEPNIGVIVLGGNPPPKLKTAKTPFSSNEIAQEAERYFKTLADGGFFSGVVIIAEQGKPIFEKSYGLASLRYNIANRLDTKFQLASLGKWFTAAAIAKLAEEGKISYTDPVEKYLPDYPVAEIKKATIHQLLTHTSGIGRPKMDWISDRAIHSLDELIALTVAPADFKPGEQVRYSNEAWLLLGKIIETVSGKSYEDYLNQKIFEPLKMKNTGLFRTDAEIPNTATPYTNWILDSKGQQIFEVGTRHSAILLTGIKGSPAGGAFSNAADLLAFGNAFLKHDFLANPELLMKPYVDGAPGQSFGYGLEVSKDERFAGKGGGSQGVSTILRVYPKRKYTVVVLSNYDGIASIAANYLNELIVE